MAPRLTVTNIARVRVSLRKAVATLASNKGKALASKQDKFHSAIMDLQTADFYALRALRILQNIDK